MDQDVKFAHICKLFIKPKKKKNGKKKIIHNFKSQQLKSSLGARHLLTNRP